MKLQIAFELTDLDQSLEIAKQVSEQADIFEVGSLLIYKYGIRAIEEFKKTFPDKTILADTKIIDRGREIMKLLEPSGINWVTVMAGINKNLIHSLCSAAHDMNKKVMLDLLDTDFIGQSALEAKSLGADALLFHKVYEESTALTFRDKWEMIQGNSTLPVFISAQISRENVDKIIEFNPDGIVVGKAICEASDPKSEAIFFAEKCASAKN